MHTLHAFFKWLFDKLEHALLLHRETREARQRLELQHNTRANRKKQCRPNETKSYSNATHPHKRQNNLTNGHTPSRIKSTRLTYTGTRPHAPGHQAVDHPVPAHTEVTTRPRCYTEKAPNAWQRRGTQKTRNTYNQPNRPTRQTSQTKHQALPKGQPGRRITPINTAAVHASAQPTLSTHTRQGHHQIFSANAARCEAQEQYRRAG